MRFKLLLFIVSVFICLKGFGKVFFDSTFTGTYEISYYHDKGEKKSYQEILHLEKKQFKKVSNDYINLGYKTKKNWYLLDANFQDTTKCFLVVSQLSLERLEVYHLLNGQLLKRYTPQGIRHNTNSAIGNRYFFSVKPEMKPNEQLLILVYNPYGSIRTGINLWSKEQKDKFSNEQSQSKPYYYLFAGIILTITLVMLLAFFIQKDMVFIFYILFALINLHFIFLKGGYITSIHQFFQAYLRFDPRAYNSYLTILFSLLYTYNLHKSFVKEKWLIYPTKFLITFTGIVLISSFFIGYRSWLFTVLSHLTAFIYLFTAIITICFPVLGMLKKKLVSFFYFLAYFVYTFIVIYDTLFLMKLMDKPFHDFGLEISILFELVIMSIALILRVTLISKDNQLLKEKLSLEQKRFIQKSIEIQNKERFRIASDLHDDIGQKLTGLKLVWYNLRSSYKKEQEHEKIDSILENTIESVRQLSHQMMPSHLIKAGLVKSIEGLCSSTSSSKITVNFESFKVPEMYDEKIIVNIYRSLQESITNSIKHGHATIIDISISYLNNKIIITQYDNGIGFNADESNFGFGLNSIQNRAEVLNGSFKIESNKTGTTSTIIFPYEDSYHSR